VKKLLLVLIIVFVASTSAFADHAQDSLALGAIFGAGWSMHKLEPHPDIYPTSLSLKIPRVPLFWGLNVKYLNNYDLGLGITGDYYFAEPNLVSTTTTNDNGSYQLKIDWYVGVGFYANLYMYSDYRGNYAGGDGGLRIPFGVSWHAMEQIKQLEVSVGSVAGLGIGGNKYLDKPYLHWFIIPLEIAVRWWFG
jgi:hypothetical protein